MTNLGHRAGNFSRPSERGGNGRPPLPRRAALVILGGCVVGGMLAAAALLCYCFCLAYLRKQRALNTDKYSEKSNANGEE